MKTLALIIAALMLAGCSTVTELGNSSGCLVTKGGYALAGGDVLICRSGKDGAAVEYKDKDGREITIKHGEQTTSSQ